MGWLVAYTLASVAASYIVVRIFDYLFGGVTGSLVNAARAGVFVTTWTAVTARSGMHGFTKRVRQLRQGATDARNRIDALTKGERL